MASKVNLSELKKIISEAEKTLEKYQENEVRKLKQMRIKRALKRAYAFLGTKGYTQDDVDKMYKVVWRSLQDIPVVWLYLLGVLLAGSIMFASYETYSFFMFYWDKIIIIPPGGNVDRAVRVKYAESNIVNLYNLISVDDEDGLEGPTQMFNISNDTTELPRHVNYEVYYNINLVELNNNYSRIINKRYIRYQLSYYDTLTNEKVYEPIGKFSDLPVNPDGTLRLFSGKQAKGHQTNFEVKIWIGPDAGNDQQNRAYSFAFNVTAVINQLR